MTEIPGADPVLRSGAAMAYFYSHLFAAEPGIRRMFPAAMDAQRRRFSRALGRIARAWAADGGTAGNGIVPDGAGDGDGENLAEYLAALGRAHRKFGVRPEHYAAFRASLLATCRQFAPPAGKAGKAGKADRAAGSLEAAFDRAARIMIAAAAEDARRAPAWWTAEVTGHARPAPGVAVLTLRPGEPLPYLPGQHVAVQTPRWPRLWRSYSVANAPREDGTLTLHVRAVPGGLVSTALVHRTAPGDVLLLGAAEGTMTADAGSGRDVLCLAGGTGLAPLKAITEAIAGGTGPGRRRNIVLYHGARTRRGLYDLPSLRRMELGYPWLRVIPATSQEKTPDARHAAIPELAARACWRDRDIYISGPDAMIAATVRALREAGAPPGRLRYDLPGHDVPRRYTLRQAGTQAPSVTW